MSRDTKVMPVRPRPRRPPRDAGASRRRAVVLGVAGVLSVVVLGAAGYLVLVKLAEVLASLLAVMVLAACGLPSDPPLYG